MSKPIIKPSTLTEKQREAIKAKYSQAMRMRHSDAMPIRYSAFKMRNLLIQLFGEDFFKKGE